MTGPRRGPIFMKYEDQTPEERAESDEVDRMLGRKVAELDDVGYQSPDWDAPTGERL